MSTLDLRGLNPAPVTPFTADGDVDHAAMAGLGKSFPGKEFAGLKARGGREVELRGQRAHGMQPTDDGVPLAVLVVRVVRLIVDDE